MKTTNPSDLAHLVRVAQVDIMFALVLGLILHLMLRAWIG